MTNIQNKLKFHEWSKERELEFRQIDMIESIIVGMSTIRYAKSKSINDGVISLFEREFPELTFDVTVDNINFTTFDELMHSVLNNIEFNSEDILYSFILQKLCINISIELLQTANTDLSRQYLKEIYANNPEIKEA